MSWTVRGLDLRVAERLCTLTGVDDPALRTVAALAAGAPRGGHVCVDLATVGGEVQVELPSPTGGWRDRPEVDPLPALGDVDAVLAAAVAAGLARWGDGPAAAAGTRGTPPLVVDGTRVYLDRYWAYEDRLHAALVARSAAVPLPDDVERVRAVLDLAAPHDAAGPAVDRQRLAVANGLLRPLSVLSGGPGTGKTHTVVSVLVANVLLAEARGEVLPRIAIAAPTGKAATRMQQAIATALRERDLPPTVLAALGQLTGRTVHRLLGTRRWEPTRFRHDATNPVPYDLVVVDEASMVPLSLMTKLVEAVPPEARLVLVGDRDQLASVEAGAVLGDVCGPQPTGSSLRLSEAWAADLTTVTGAPVHDERDPVAVPGVWDGIVQLERFRRFGEGSGIGAVARAIQRATGQPDDVLALLEGRRVEEGAAVDRYDDVALVAPVDGTSLPPSLRGEVTSSLQPYLDAVFTASAVALDDDAAFETAARSALEAVDALRVLCAVRRGPHGVGEVGALVESWMADADPRLAPDAGWYEGRPVIVTRNDHDLAVMNGDVGVTLRRGGRLVVAFATTDDGVRIVPAVRVADCETVWAMTIHKSQGSQFPRAVVVLPTREVEVVSRELVYTGVTRAAEHVTVVATRERLRDAVERPVRRATGLRERLWP